MGYQDPPRAGEAFIRGRETRTVSDRTLGGDVLYYTGTKRRRHYQITEAQWIEWCSKAQCVECGGQPGLVWNHYQYCSKAPAAPEDQSLSPDSERALALINAIVAERYGLDHQSAPPFSVAQATERIQKRDIER